VAVAAVVEPDVLIESATAPRATLRLLLGALALGALLLFPSFFYLFRVFKGQTAFVPLDGEPGAKDEAVINEG
jgi:cytochrome bd-type quinol oxidase subunit 2